MFLTLTSIHLAEVLASSFLEVCDAAHIFVKGLTTVRHVESVV